MKISQMPLVKRFYSTNTTEKTDEKTVLSSEVEHINQELYKKGAELAERNKALSLLGAIDEIILSSIVSQDKIAQQVTSLLVVEAAFQIVSVFSYDKEINVLRRVGISHAKTTSDNQTDINLYLTTIPLTQTSNFIIQAINEREIKFSHSLDNLLFSPEQKTIADAIQLRMGVKSSVVFPLIARNQLIGAMVICLTHDQQELLEYQRTLIDRLGELIGIAMDNAMLYQQVQVANKKLQDANNQLKVLDKLKNEFVSVASHELRTPMTAIKSYLWMALKGKGGVLNEKQKYYIERSYNSVDRLVRLVNDMLNISRIESGHITIDFQQVDLNTLVQEVVDEVLPRAGEVGVSVTVQKLGSLPAVLADPDKIKEVLFNLIGNSLKFTPRGGSITVNFAQQNGFIETTVKDTGAGISPENIGKLFQKFGLLPGSYITNQTTTGGTGLGLYICRSIIDLHHGIIKAESEGVGKGTTFTFSLKVYNEGEYQLLKKVNADPNTDKIGLIHAQI
jgi:two-component system sensor histidine kinase/response regulator